MMNIKDSKDVWFPAGTYYIGDLCYCKAINWTSFCEQAEKNGVGLADVDGMKLWWNYTAYGDGTYVDDSGCEYSVDAGLIGIVSFEDIKNDEYPEETITVFNTPFKVSYDNGTFRFGHIAIETD